MKRVTYIRPNKQVFLASVKYTDGEEKLFDYVVGGYRKDKHITTLINVKDEDVVDLLDGSFSKIVFLNHKKEISE
jgi:hypothetical protein